jgi:hypothetical protein
MEPLKYINYISVNMQLIHLTCHIIIHYIINLCLPPIFWTIASIDLCEYHAPKFQQYKYVNDQS